MCLSSDSKKLRVPYCAKHSSLDQGEESEVVMVLEEWGGMMGLFDRWEWAIFLVVVVVVVVAAVVDDDDDDLEEEGFLLEGLEEDEEEEREEEADPALALVVPAPTVVEAVLSVYSIEVFSPPASARVSRPKPAITAAVDETARDGPLPLSPFSIPRCSKNIPTIEIISRQVQTPRTRITMPLRRSMPPCG